MINTIVNYLEFAPSSAMDGEGNILQICSALIPRDSPDGPLQLCLFDLEQVDGCFGCQVLTGEYLVPRYHDSSVRRR